MHRTWKHLVSALILIVSIAGCSTGNEETASSDSQVRLILATGVPSVGGAMYTSLPQELGYWRDAGLDVSINMLSGSSEALQIIESGQGDVTVSGTSSLMLAAAAGSDLSSFYTVVTRSFQNPATKPDSGIERFRDLAGRQVGVQSLGSSTVQIIKGHVEADGGNPDDVQFITVGVGAEALAALDSGDVDALGLWDDRYAEIESLGQPLNVLTSPAADSVGWQVALAAKPKWVESNRNAAIQLARGIAMATVFATENPEAAVRLHWKAYPLTRPAGVDEATALAQGVRALQARLANSTPVDGQWGNATTEQVTAFQDLLVSTGVVNGSIEGSGLWSADLINEINNFDHEAVREQARNWTA
jgi:NitT/TauT family transport system substrate-binding protein